MISNLSPVELKREPTDNQSMIRINMRRPIRTTPLNASTPPLTDSHMIHLRPRGSSMRIPGSIKRVMNSTTSIQVQTYVVMGLIIGCFALLYPRIFHPILMRALGASSTSEPSRDYEANMNFHHSMLAQQSPYPHQAAADARTISKIQSSKRSNGVLMVVLPAYVTGIVIYLLYTLTKLYKARNRKLCKKRHEYLRQYYRDFHYDTGKEKFRMSYRDSSDDDDDDDSAKSRTLNSGNTLFGDSRFNDIFRSAENLPLQLENLLIRIKESDSVDSSELNNLRIRLEQTERVMSQLLETMDYAGYLLPQSINKKRAYEPFVSTVDTITTESPNKDLKHINGDNAYAESEQATVELEEGSQGDPPCIGDEVRRRHPLIE